MCKYQDFSNIYNKSLDLPSTLCKENNFESQIIETETKSVILSQVDYDVGDDDDDGPYDYAPVA